MAKIFRAPEGRFHIVNPSLDLDLKIGLRRRNRPRSRWRPEGPEELELELAAWLIRQAVASGGGVEEPPAEMLQRAVEAGLLAAERPRLGAVRRCGSRGRPAPAACGRGPLRGSSGVRTPG